MHVVYRTPPENYYPPGNYSFFLRTSRHQQFFPANLRQINWVLSGSAVKVSACHTGDLGLTPGFGRSPGEGKGYLPLAPPPCPPQVFWPGEVHGLNSPWGLKESDMNEGLSHVEGKPALSE